MNCSYLTLQVADNPIVITQASIWLQLVNDKATTASCDAEPPLHPDITPSVLIGASIDLEDQQCQLCVDTVKLGLHTTDMQKAKIQQHINALAQCIKAWSQIQVLFIPRVAALQDLPTQPTNEKLNCPRGSLWSRSYMLKFKDQFLCGWGTNMHAWNCLKSIDTKISASTAKYRMVYSALSTLAPLLGPVRWKNGLHPLTDKGICAMTKGKGEGRRRLSWIWLLCGYTDSMQDTDDMGLQDTIHTKWCKARVRVHHWEEEVDILFEEKQHTLQFLHWHVGWWSRKVGAAVIGDSKLSEGLQAYAQCQATLHLELARSFEHIWCDTQHFHNIADSVETPSPLTS
ncbi:hypothetical protein PAXRUDRAFT_174820 [Paxillus rubicundulus Ve08.2h10]|uniref:Uncharacterized protein n=1 Tax=Paxillus rubicundulus Ve08.2h10 TaxID=930991 RepID=A0A0D0BTH7_9AGAM|nr:hypothetical protein PAXRUDRAFT_174820 [Paxillus rubicundulus Ve08.2h10]